MTILPLPDEILSSVKVYHNKPESKMKKIRKSRGMTQQDVSYRTRISVSLLSQYELGDKRIPENRLILIAKALRCDPSDLC